MDNGRGLPKDPKIEDNECLLLTRPGRYHQLSVVWHSPFHLYGYGNRYFNPYFHSSTLVSTLDLYRNHICRQRSENFVQGNIWGGMAPNDKWESLDKQIVVLKQFVFIDEGVGDVILNVEPLAIREVELEFKSPETFKLISGNGEEFPNLNGDSNFLLLKGARERNEKCVSKWVLNKMKEFGSFLGISFDDFENETLELFKRMVERRSGGLRGEECGEVVPKRLKNELKKLKSSVNYEEVGWLSDGTQRRGKCINLL